ncbi:hypothetical protein ASE90_01805 [Sphingomonas sp. Leaf67]|nr:hypothetical protein ASE90_01805 [Sphingomonas sp. Leaf67]
MHQTVASHRPIDVLEPLAELGGAFACSPNALSSWAITAATNRRCVYARVPRIGAALGERARLLARTGAVQINQVRSKVDPELFEYIATRTNKPFAADPVVLDKLPQAAVDVLDLLERCAARGLSCPTNAQISATLIGMTPQRVSDTICKLRDFGLLRVSAPNIGGVARRTITIVSTGETLCPAG